jgi:hypothetical protein
MGGDRRDKAVADLLLVTGLVNAGMSVKKAVIYWLGVTLFGGSHFNWRKEEEE